MQGEGDEGWGVAHGLALARGMVLVVISLPKAGPDQDTPRESVKKALHGI
jgi:hypothetical protein